MKKALVILLSIMLVASAFSASFAAAPKSDKQDDIITKWEKNSDKFEMKWNDDKGVPRFVRGQLSDKPVKTEEDVKDFLTKICLN